MKIALFGYGKMGKEIEQIALQKHTIALKIDLHNAESFSKNELMKCDVAIEFSTPHSVVTNILKCFEANIPVVVGTTGWYDKLEEVKKICKEKNQCLFYSSNFSIGVNIFFELNKQLAKMMNNYPDYQVSIEEIHHIYKLDAPSGTAISLANQIIDNISRKKKWINTLSVSSQIEREDELPIISTREDEVTGTHIVKYHSAIDDIEIMHKAHNRKGFATGAMIAAEFIANKKGIFTMDDLMNPKFK
ncbi:MAG: 4-hydroxy-tetrahydrodipicolinate reductase [Bacteroidota bacterium]